MSDDTELALSDAPEETPAETPEPEVSAPAPKNKGGRPKGSKTKKNRPAAPSEPFSGEVRAPPSQRQEAAGAGEPAKDAEVVEDDGKVELGEEGAAPFVEAALALADTGCVYYLNSQLGKLHKKNGLSITPQEHEALMEAAKLEEASRAALRPVLQSEIGKTRMSSGDAMWYMLGVVAMGQMTRIDAAVSRLANAWESRVR